MSMVAIAFVIVIVIVVQGGLVRTSCLDRWGRLFSRLLAPFLWIGRLVMS